MEPPRPDSLISIYDAQAMRNRNLSCPAGTPPPPDCNSDSWTRALRSDFCNIFLTRIMPTAPFSRSDHVETIAQR
jgi:hypothetical protein